MGGIAINHLIKKSSIKTSSEPAKEAVHKQDKDYVLRMATVVHSEPPLNCSSHQKLRASMF